MKWVVFFSWLALLPSLAFSLTINREIEKGFEPEQKKIIEEALKLLEARLADNEVFNCVNLAKKASVNTDYLKKTPLHNQDTLIPSLMSLQWMSLLSDKEQFPLVRIKAFKEEDASHAYSRKENFVLPALFSPNGKAEGEFEVFLNSALLGAPQGEKQAELWAGAIAHQLFHNLGHQHAEKADNRLEYQLDRVEACVVTSGKLNKEADQNVTFSKCGEPAKVVAEKP